MARSKFIQVENKNAILELLEAGKEFVKIYIVHSAFKDPKTRDIQHAAHSKGIPIERVSKRTLERRLRTSKFESVVGMMISDNNWELDDLLDSIYSNNQIPFFLILNKISYAQNIGAIMRTAFAAGVNGIITPVKKGNYITDEILRISMGAAERIPIVEMSLFAAYKVLQENDIKLFGLDMEGDAYYESDLSGPAAFILGSESEGLSSRVLEKVDKVLSIPMVEGIGSINVSASAAIVMYEKMRQDKSLKSSKN